MPDLDEFFANIFSPHANHTLDVLLGRLIISLLLGCVVAGIYALAQKKSRAEMVPFLTTLILLTVLITMVTLVIGESQARAFSLVGALAIIRFRTVVEDTRDTAFVIFAVAVGMGAGAGMILVPLVGIPILAIPALTLSHWGRNGPASVPLFSLEIRTNLGADPGELCRNIFSKYLESWQFRFSSTARQGSAMDYGYHARLRQETDAIPFTNELNRLEGIQNIELRKL